MLKQASIVNEDSRLHAAVIAESAYRELFRFNSTLSEGLDPLICCILLSDQREADWRKVDWAATWLNEGARSYFGLCGLNLKAWGDVPYRVSSGIKAAKTLILKNGEREYNQTTRRTQTGILQHHAALMSMDDAAIVSVNGDITVPCNVDTKGLAKAVGEIAEKLRFFSDERNDEIARYDAAYKAQTLTWDFGRLAKTAVEQVQKTEKEVRQWVLHAIFPHAEQLELLEDLYPEARAEELRAIARPSSSTLIHP